jgi:hypothetical protein
MMSLKRQAPLEVCEVVTTIPTRDSTSPSRFDEDLAAKAWMMKKGLNRIFIAPVVPRELRSLNRPLVGAVSDLIPLQIGQRAANEIGAWPDLAAVKIRHRVAQALGIAATNAKISAEAPGLLQLHPPGLSPRHEPLQEPLDPTSAVQLQPLCAAVVA